VLENYLLKKKEQEKNSTANIADENKWRGCPGL
jgi:hypothetical protein